MADAIRVSLTPDKMTVQPDGDPVESVITIQNTGATVDQYAVELDQLPTTWYSLSNTSVALFPQDREEAKLLIHPPKGGGAKAGTYPFTVTVLSRADSSQISRADGVLQVGAVAAFEMAMSPNKVTGRKGRYTLSLRNGGNADIDVALEASDQDESCRYGLRPRNVTLGAGQRTTARLVVRPRRSNIAGSKKSFDFQVKAVPSRGEPKTVPGQLVHRPTFRTWRPIRRLVFLLVLLLLVGVAVISLGGISGSSNHASGWKHSAQTFLCDHVKVFCNGAGKAVTPPGPTAVPTGTIQKPKVGVTASGTAVFVFAFKDFHDHAQSLVGDPKINETTTNGEATQQTTNGMLLFDHKSGHAFLFRTDSTVWEYYNGKLQEVR